jgi:hypothetical protein
VGIPFSESTNGFYALSGSRQNTKEKLGHDLTKFSSNILNPNIATFRGFS